MESSARVIDQAALLDELMQVSGVLGSMLVSHEGELLLQRLPGALAARAGDAAPRLSVLLEGLTGGRLIQAVCLRFFAHRLHVLSLGDNFLCVISDLSSQSPVLKMAMNVTARRLS